MQEAVSGVLITLFFAVALSMDAFSVSLAGGSALKKDVKKTALITGLIFGAFHLAMLYPGWFFGEPLIECIHPFDDWIVIAIFVFFGGKMIFDTFFEKEKHIDLVGIKTLLLLAFATSLDALAVGINYAYLADEIILPSLIIGGTTFLFSFCGVLAGNKLKRIFGNKVQFIGGVLLLLLAAKTIIDMIV
ncbi:MAG TPA: manganese efflux pump [Methanocorpusculum sp.]|nr:manganese efflux pump [Methanocorpusculum sp.]